MGFTAKLALSYIVLLAIDIVAFAKKKKAIAVTLAIIMVLGFVVLGYLWITSPM